MRKRVLVVDDVPDWRATLQAILRNEYEVKTVDSYQAAMEVIRERSAELVIVDLRLSPTNEEDRQGMDLLRQLAEHRINAIVLTGYPEKELREEAEDKYKTFAFMDKSALAENVQRLREVVQEAFNLLELKEKAKMRAIQAASALQTVTFPEELSSWPLRKYRKDK
ncbi:MAG: response regulator [Anaerolineales bacterium]|nr:response regulator [Anaerolineales bacterium]